MEAGFGTYNHKKALIALLFLLQLSSAAAYGGKKKSKFLEAYPMVFKFLLFWWCVFVFAVMTVYIIDHLMYKKFGPAKVVWRAERFFKGVSREELWAQLADPSKWSKDHPVLQTADISLVSNMHDPPTTPDKEANEAEEISKAKEESHENSDPHFGENAFETPKKRCEPIELGPLRKGHGMLLRHKADSGPQAGRVFCLRECSQIEEPVEGPFLLVMRTIEGGLGYPFLENTEISEVEMFPSEDGTVRCKMTGMADVTSRIFRWWAGLQKDSQASAVAFLESLDQVSAVREKS